MAQRSPAAAQCRVGAATAQRKAAVARYQKCLRRPRRYLPYRCPPAPRAPLPVRLVYFAVKAALAACNGPVKESGCRGGRINVVSAGLVETAELVAFLALARASLMQGGVDD